jgi:hypothetical protein
MDVTDHETTLEYEPPVLVDFGDLFELTAGHRDGDHLDADFPAGTSRGDLGFS